MKKGLMTALCGGMMVLGLLGVVSSQANDEYNQGAGYAREIQGQGIHALKDFKPGEALPNYTENPAEKNYYGGVTTPSTNLDNQGSQALVNSDVGKAITESILNNPKEPLSMDAPFIAVGTEAQEKAEQVTDGSFDGCVEQSVSNTEFTNHICARDTQVEQACTRTATISGDWVDSSKDVDVIINSTQLSFYAYGNGKNRDDGARTTYIVPAGINGPILSATLTHSGSGSTYMMMQILGTEVNTSDGTRGFSPAVTALTAGQAIPINIILSSRPSATVAFYNNRQGTFTIVLRTRTGSREFIPKIVWSEVCPFSKTEGAITKTECIEPAGNKTITIEGKPYTLYSACWAYKDTYVTQAESEGTCGSYAANPACTIATRQCAYSLDGFCMRENLTYSCESKTSGTGMMCGGQFFCTDGSCALAAAGTNNMFAHAVSQLAAVAAAGKDVAELNDVNVKAFTGRGQSCKKFAVGFNNCCKDSGWGADLGLASCSSEEKALGQAKERKLTIDVGEYCSKKVLGVCLEKKRSYCVFDSKLAQIIQQQGRQWQLGIGFGAAESPDCRGITVEELQGIQFDRVDFSNFKEDLNSGSAVPGDNDLLDRVKQQIEAQLNKNTGGK